MNRRTFLQSSLSCAALAAVPGSLSAADSAAVRGERPLLVSLDEELLVAETVLRVSDML